MKCNQSRPGFELVSPCPFPTTLTITSRAPSFRINTLWHSCRMGYRSMADTRPKGPQLRLGHPRVGELLFFTPMHSLYSTRPYGLVQAIFWHTCPDLDFGPWYCLTHEVHIAFSGSMTSRVRVSARSRPPSPCIPTLIDLRDFDLVSSPVWLVAVTNIILLGKIWTFLSLQLWVR